MEAFRHIHPKTLKGIPLDRSMSGYFRKNPQFGSKDRRRISSTLFGYYRWYGWLRQLSDKEIDLALLLGYLLDGNEISTFVKNWAESLGLTMSRLKEFEDLKVGNINDKSSLAKKFIEDNRIRTLMPEFLNFDDETLINLNQYRAPTWLRVQDWARKEFLGFLGERGVGYELFADVEGAIKLDKPVNLFESRVFKNGGVEIQDLSSQMVGLICSPRKGESWWDMCSGSGGKALHLASLMGGKGKIYATDIRELAVRECKKRANWGKWHNIKSIHWNGEKIPEFNEKLSGILIDAPCSCSGTWRRSPDLRWSLSQEKILSFAETQLKILTLAAGELPKGGKLIYATCSLLPQENEEVIRRFLDFNPGIALVDDFKVSGLRSQVNGGFYLGPPALDGNFMFISQMVRK